MNDSLPRVLKAEDAVFCPLAEGDFYDCLDNSASIIKAIIDRKDLHERSFSERYIDVLMGEMAEKSVVNWLQSNGKFADRSDKCFNMPDNGYDIVLHDIRGNIKYCSIKSSLSVYKNNISQIISSFQLSSKKSEISDVNIQVYFWLNIDNAPRITVPSNNNMAIIGWIGKPEAYSIGKTAKYNTENRETVSIELSKLHPMKELLKYLS